MSGSERAAGRRFDRERGVTTQALLFLSELDPRAGGEALSHATHYEPVPVGAFRALLAEVPEADVRASTFVDVGAGMGRALLLAREYPFKQIVGIELSPALAEIARRNVATAGDGPARCRDVRLIRADARRRRFPRGPLVAFLFNPFDGDALDAVLDRIAERGNARSEWILYHTPVHAQRLEARGYRLVAQLSESRVYCSAPLACTGGEA
jgi:SAM-dependent methyltransferase